MHLGLWQLLSTTIQVLTLIVVLQPTSHGHDHSLILQEHNTASIRIASWLKILVLQQTFLANQLLSSLQSVLARNTAAEASLAIKLADYSLIKAAE